MEHQQEHQQDQQLLSPKQEFLKDAGYKLLTFSGSSNPVEVMADAFGDLVLGKEVLNKFLYVRKVLIEQKAYLEMGLYQETLNMDIAAQASLWGQIQLVDIFLESVKLAQDS